MIEEELETQENAGKIFQVKQLNSIQQVRKILYRAFSLNGHKRIYDKGNTVFQVNDPSNEAYLVENGRVRTYKLTPEGKEVTFEILNPGEGLALAEMIVNSPRTRYAETLSDKTTLWVMDKEQVYSLLASDLEFGFALTFGEAYHILRYQSLVEDLTFLPVRGRVIQLLARMSKDRGRQVEDCRIMDFPFTHEEIAKMVGSSRQTVTVILNELRQQGILSWEQKNIKILRWNDLNEQAHECK